MPLASFSLMRARNSSVVRSGSRTNTETNLGAAADLIAAARALTGGRRQHRGCLALLEAGGMARAASRRVLEQARISLEEPGHALVVGALRRRLESVIAAWL